MTMSLNDLRQSAAAEHKAQFTTGTLTLSLRRQSARVAGVGDQPARTIAVPACDMPVSSFGVSAGGGEASVLLRRYRVWAEDLVLDGLTVSVGRGMLAEYRRNDAAGQPTGEPVRATVVETSSDMGGACVMLECQVDRASSGRGEV